MSDQYPFPLQHLQTALRTRNIHVINHTREKEKSEREREWWFTHAQRTEPDWNLTGWDSTVHSSPSLPCCHNIDLEIITDCLAIPLSCVPVQDNLPSCTPCANLRHIHSHTPTHQSTLTYQRPSTSLSIIHSDNVCFNIHWHTFSLPAVCAWSVYVCVCVCVYVCVSRAAVFNYQWITSPTIPYNLLVFVLFFHSFVLFCFTFFVLVCF